MCVYCAKKNKKEFKLKDIYQQSRIPVGYILEILFTLASYSKPTITLQGRIQGVQKVQMRSPFTRIILSHFEGF